MVVKSKDFGVTNLLNQNLKEGDGAAAVLRKVIVMHLKGRGVSMSSPDH